MATQRGFRPQMPVGKLRSPAAFSQQEPQPQPTLRGAPGAAPGVGKFGFNKTAVATSASPPGPALTPTPQTPAAAAATTITTTIPPAASPNAPTAGNKVNLSKFQPASPTTAPTPRASAPTPSAVAAPTSAPAPTVAKQPPVATPGAQSTPPATAPTTNSSAAAPTTAPATAPAALAVAKQPPVATPPAQTATRVDRSPAPASAATTAPTPTTPAAAAAVPRSRADVPSTEVLVPASAPKAASAPSPAPAPQPASAAAPSTTTQVAEVSQPKSPPVVVLDPATELVFRGAFSEGVTTRLRLTNKSPDNRVCFKVKTNAPPFYNVHPSIDIIEPLQDFDVTVYLQATSGEQPDVDGPHKFMIQSIFAPNGQITSLEKLWQQARPTEIASAKLACVFEKIQQEPRTVRRPSFPSGVDLIQARSTNSTEARPSKATKTQSSSSSVGVLVLLFAAAAAVIAAVVYQFTQ